MKNPKFLIIGGVKIVGSGWSFVMGWDGATMRK